MVECEYCRDKLDLSFQCAFCHKYFCKEHLPAHKHFCPSISREDAISEIVDKTTVSKTLSGSLLLVTTMIGYAFVLGMTVFAVDAVVLLLLNLSLETLPILLWWEGIVMASFGGVAGLTHRKTPDLWATPLGRRLYRIDRAVRKPLFWASFGMAGFILIISAYLIWITS
jgi:hypothetical protein